MRWTLLTLFLCMLRHTISLSTFEKISYVQQLRKSSKNVASNRNEDALFFGKRRYHQPKVSYLAAFRPPLLSLLMTKECDPNHGYLYSRRASLATSLGVITSTVGSMQQQKPQASWAASSEGITDADKARIKQGYETIAYLLNNFDQETTVCRENGGECKRNPDAIRKALGLRSTTDPFFQIEKVFAKAKFMSDTMDIDKLEALFDATEDWNSAVNMSNSMAFISQFGEYNPGGGQDAVLKYLIESQKQVLLAKTALEKIMDSLDIPR